MLRLVLFFVVVLFTIWRFNLHDIAIYASNPDKKRVVYGEDNRLDFYEMEDHSWFPRVQATAALFDKDDMVWSEKDEAWLLMTEHYGLSFGLCKDEPFYDQPTGAFCSGFLVDRDLLVTAGHCMRNKYNCERVRFVFGYYYGSVGADPLTMGEDRVYGCKQIIHTQAHGNGADFALIQLDRAVVEFSPLEIRLEGQVQEGDEFTVVGYPKGIPGKIAHGGHLRKNDHPSFFVTNLDSFGGSSGSAVFNTDTGLVEGILVRGEKDFAFDQSDRCRRSYVCDEMECRGEDVVRMSEVLKYLQTTDLVSKN